MYHTQVVTLMRLADLPVGYARPASYVDLPASIDVSHSLIIQPFPSDSLNPNHNILVWLL